MKTYTPSERKLIHEKAKRLLRGEDVDYIQDPATGRFEGSRPGGDGGDSNSDSGSSSSGDIYAAAKSVRGKLNEIGIGKGEYIDQRMESDKDTPAIAAQGKLWTDSGRTVVKGKRNDCHLNVARLYKQGKIDAVATGYAFDKSWGWYQHSWGLKGGKVVETTSTEFSKYYGIALEGDDAKKFVVAQIKARG